MKIMKKTILASITLLLISLSFNVKAQQTYMPVFGNDSTVFYYYLYVGNNYQFCKEIWIKVKEKENTYVCSKSFCNVSSSDRDTLEISDDYSKIWLKTPGWNEKILIMDLNLKVGDSYYRPDYNATPRIVTDVYIKNGRKHIIFNEKFPVVICRKCDETDNAVFYDFSLRFIEGVGPNIHLSAYFIGGETVESLPILCSQNKDNEIAYGIPEFYPYWGLWWINGSLTGTDNVNVAELNATPMPVNDMLKLTLPEGINFYSGNITVRDITGAEKQKIAVLNNPADIDFSAFSSGVYLVEVNAQGYRDTIKVIKK